MKKFDSPQAARHQLHMDVMACERLGTIRNTQSHTPADLEELAARAMSVLETVAFLRTPPAFQLYQSVERWEVRPYVTGEDVSRITFNEVPCTLPSLAGGYIVRKPHRPDECWYITAFQFAQKFERAPETAPPSPFRAYLLKIEARRNSRLKLVPSNGLAGKAVWLDTYEVRTDEHNHTTLYLTVRCDPKDAEAWFVPLEKP